MLDRERLSVKVACICLTIFVADTYKLSLSDLSINFKVIIQLYNKSIKKL